VKYSKLYYFPGIEIRHSVPVFIDMMESMKYTEYLCLLIPQCITKRPWVFFAGGMIIEDIRGT
jgi:hypothetical protein